MNRPAAFISLILPACLLGGCVTAHQADVKIILHDHAAAKDLNDALLLTIRGEAPQPEGHWWVVEDEEHERITPCRAEVRVINTGDTIHQEGQVVALLGPYVYCKPLGWEYWVFRDSYQPTDFLDYRLERRYKLGKPVKLLMLKELPSRADSDEKVLDGARKLIEVAELLNDDEPTNRLIRLVTRQVRSVQKVSFRSRHKQAAGDLLNQLAEKFEDLAETQPTR